MQLLTARNQPSHTASSDQASGPVAIAWVHQQVQAVFQFARAMGADRDLAADLTQEAFGIAWQKGKAQLPEAALATYLRRTVRYCWLQHHRSERRKEAATTAWTERLQQQDQPGDRDARIARTRECINQLKGRAKQAVHLRYSEEHSREQIATALELTPNGVKTLLARTRRWLEQCLQRTTS